MNDCIFCKIIAKQIPATLIFEDDKIIAFLDIRPVNPGHVLVVPKIHVEDTLAADAETLQACILGVQKIGQAVVSGLGVTGFNIGVNNGPVAGQLVPHLHFHVMPRTAGDGFKLWHGTPYADDAQRDEVAAKLKSTL